MSARRIQKRLILGWCVVTMATSSATGNWPGWRGDGSGISSGTDLPLTWSEDRNVRWKVAIGGAGHSSPIVWNGRVFITTAVPNDPNVMTFRGGVYMGGNRAKPDESEYAYCVIALDAETGKVLWSTPMVQQRPKTRRHTKNTYASETPVTDGTHVFASFGPAGLHCLDFEGHVIWQRDLGLLRGKRGWGTAASPILFQDTVIVVGDNDDQSYVAAFEKTTGDPFWRTEREEGASWGTPFLFQTDEGPIVVTNATRRMRGYDAKTGRLLWECGSGSMISVPSPVATEGLVFLCSGHNLMRPQPIFAIRAGARGDITPAKGQSQTEGVAWWHALGGPYVTSPIAIDRYLYVPLDRGTLTSYDARTGEMVYERQRLGARNTITASPVAAGGRLYLQTEDGECYVIKQGPEFEILAVNKLEETFCASPAISAGRLFLRGRKHLYCVGD